MASEALLRLLDAVLIIFIGFILARVAGRTTRGAIHELDVQRLARRVGFRAPLEQPVGIAVEVFIAAGVIVLALFRLGVLKPVAFALLIALGIIAVLLIVPAVRDGVPNLFAAVTLPHARLREGATLRSKDMTGMIVRKRFLSVELKTKQGDRLDVPLAYLRKEGFS